MNFSLSYWVRTACLAVSLSSPLLGAAEIKVEAPPANGKTKTIGEALEKARPGDTLLLGAGIYYERVIIHKPVTIQGEQGTILDGSLAFEGEWKAADDELPGVYVLPMKHRPKGVLWDEKIIAGLDFRRAEKKGEWHWKTLLKKGPPLSGFEQIKALSIFHPEEKRLYVRLPDGEKPDARRLRYIKNDEALVTLQNTKNVTLSGLTLRHGADAIKLENAGQCRIEKCEITSFEKNGILITDDSHNSVVEGCKIERGALEEWTPNLKDNKINYEIWLIHKEVGYYDRIGINLFRAGSNNRVLNNHISLVFDGVCIGDYACESLDKPLTHPDHGRGTVIAGNIIENTRDSGIELGVGCIDVHVHHNTLRKTHGGFRFKTPRIGPVFIHHNLLVDGSPFNFWFSMDASPAIGYIYHNTIVNGSAALSLLIHKPTEEFTAPKWHFYNNLVLTKAGFFKNRKKGLAIDFSSGNNITTAGNPPWPEDKERDADSRYDVDIPLAEPTADKPVTAAIDAGRDLSTLLDGKPLPGAERSTVKGKAPDVGMLEWK